MGIQEWVLGIAVKKAVQSAVKLIISMASSVVVAGYLEQLGVKIDPLQLEAGLTIVINSLLKIGMNYAKTKLGWKFIA